MSQPTPAVHKKYKNSPKGRYSAYRATAVARGIAFNLTFEQFMKYWQVPCHYCGYAIHTIGLDRVDNSRGYDMDNIVSCCARDNMAKNRFTQEQYFELCRNVVLRHGLISGQPPAQPSA